MTPKSPTRLEAERLCKAFPESPSKTLARRLAKSHKCSLNAAELHIRRSRGAAGVSSRRKTPPTSPRPLQPAGWKPEMPPSLAEPWVPFDLGNSIRVAVLSDIHVPYHSTVALRAAVDHCKKRKPTHLLINGDAGDFYSCSRYQTDPSKRDMPGDLESVSNLFRWLRSEFGKKCEIFFKKGNHEERWDIWLWNHAAELSSSPRMSLAEWIDADQHGITIVGDQRPVMLGKLPVLHGHELGRGGGVNPARWLYLKTSSTMIIGHGHRTSEHTEPDWKHHDSTCWTTGCLSELYPRYARVNKWNWGSAFVEVDGAGEFEVENFRIGPSGEIWK